MVEFKEWPKIPRGGNAESVTITEKIDGTNGCIIIDEFEGQLHIVGVQSRNRMLTTFVDGTLLHNGDDNFGFAKWVMDNKEELLGLGKGYHYGEWAGNGIQQNPHNLKGRKFYLFNSFRWNKLQGVNEAPNGRVPPACCDVVPVLYEGPYRDGIINEVMKELLETAKVEGYAPEGVVTWFHRGRRYEKATFAYERGKWAVAS